MPKVKTLPQALLSVVIAVGFFGVFVYLLHIGVEVPVIQQVILIMVGCLVSNFTTIVNYFFGSSAGSARKDELVAQAATVTAAEVAKAVVTTPAPATQPPAPERAA